MKKLLLLFPLILVGCEEPVNYNVDVEVSYNNGEAKYVEVTFMDRKIFIKNKDQLYKFRNSIQSVISDLNRAEELFPHEQKTNSKQISQ